MGRASSSSSKEGWEEAKRKGDRPLVQRAITSAWADLAAFIEEEICGVLDEVDKHGLPKQSFTGRSEAPKIIKVPLLAPRISAPYGNYFSQHAKVWSATRLKQMAFLAKAWQQSAGNMATLRQWQQTQRAFSNPIRS